MPNRTLITKKTLVPGIDLFSSSSCCCPFVSTEVSSGNIGCMRTLGRLLLWGCVMDCKQTYSVFRQHALAISIQCTQWYISTISQKCSYLEIHLSTTTHSVVKFTLKAEGTVIISKTYCSKKNTEPISLIKSHPSNQHTVCLTTWLQISNQIK